MNGFNVFNKPFLRCKSLAIVTISFLLGGMTSADAAAMKSHSLKTASIHAASASSSFSWRTFLAGGEQLWSRVPAPAFPSGIHLASVNGRLVETQFVDYLLWRRSLNPIRFDEHHPNIALPLAQLLIPPATPSEPTLNPQPQDITVPEPSMILITFLTFGSGFVWFQRNRRDPSV